MEQRFDVRMDPEAAREYQKLDGSVRDAVNKAIDELELRADEVGKDLRNTQSTKLAGCKEIKLRDAGIRIIFRVTNEKVDVLRIVYVLTIEQRSKDLVFKLAQNRFERLKVIPTTLKDFFSRSKRWSDLKKRKKKK